MSEGGRADTSSMLFSVHKHLQARCADRSAAYLACKKNDQNPAACLEEGAKVTGCMLDLLKELKGKSVAKNMINVSTRKRLLALKHSAK